MMVNALNIFALSLELLGVLFLANHYLKVRLRKVPRLLLGAVLRNNYAKKVADVARLSDDDPTISLQGLAMIAIGFAIQLAINASQFLLMLAERF